MSEMTTPEFDSFADSYDTLLEDPMRGAFAKDPLHFHRRKWLLMQHLLRNAGVEPNSLRWLDAGCGRGELLNLAGRHFKQATGCDPSAGMLSSCSSFTVHRQTSPLELPFPDDSMDLVTAVCVYHHVPEESRVLLAAEMKRVLAPGGLCCIIEHNPWNPVTQAIVRRCPVDVDARLLTAATARAILKAAGFEPLTTSQFLYLPESLFDRLAPLERTLTKIPLGGQYAVLARRSIVTVKGRDKVKGKQSH
jgi:SAM-dependent methyltransferase